MKAINDMVPMLLSDRQQSTVRIAALQIVSVVAKLGKPVYNGIPRVDSEFWPDIFRQIIIDSLQELVQVAACTEDDAVEKWDDIFRIEVLGTLFDLARNGPSLPLSDKCLYINVKILTLLIHQKRSAA
jgi:hypothetical protein